MFCQHQQKKNNNKEDDSHRCAFDSKGVRCSHAVLRSVANFALTNGTEEMAISSQKKQKFSFTWTSQLRRNKPLDEGDDVGLYPALNLELLQFLPTSLFLGRELHGCRPKLENRFQRFLFDFPFVNLFQADLQMQLPSIVNSD